MAVSDPIFLPVPGIRLGSAAAGIKYADRDDLVIIELADTAVVGDLDGAEVVIDVVRQTRPDVLTVPVDALLALREGGYAIEMVAEDGSTYLTAVDIGLFDDAGVEVSGSFNAGDTVVVPA